MKQAVSAAKVLVASDNVDDANQILRQLKGSFASVVLSTDPDSAVADFEKHAPAVLVLAFDRLDKAQRYYLGLYRLGPTVQQHLHRTVILCNKDEVHAVFELCQNQYFDDYVLYWPHTHDGPRLAMSIWNACREMAAMRSQAPRPMALFAHARQIDELDRVLGRELADTDAHAAGSGSSLASAESANAWRRRVKDQIEPALAGARALADQVRQIRPVVMVVEDDALTRLLVGRTLDPLEWETVFASDAAQALGQLRRMRPDVILMDIRLPGIDGVALTRQLKAAPHLAEIPVIMMTGDARRETLLSSLGAGAAGFVVKPFTRESLRANLDKVLSRQGVGVPGGN